MPTRITLSRADTFFVGSAYYSRANSKPGVEATPLFFHNFGAPTAAAANNICASQSVTLPATALINGTLASGGVATTDVPRALAAAWTNTAVLTVTGTDQYGSIMKESSASGTSFTGKKAFKTITLVEVSANVTGLTVGTGDVLGLPYRIAANGLLAARANNAIDAGVFVPADTTDPATATTGDTRGTFDPAVALNGSNTCAVLLKINSISGASGTNTKVGAYGVKQFGSTDSV